MELQCTQERSQLFKMFVHLKFLAGVDCVFSDFDGEKAAGVYSGAVANFVQCEFNNNTLLSETGASAVIECAGFDDDYADYDGFPFVRSEECTFSGNIPETTPVLRSGADF